MLSFNEESFRGVDMNEHFKLYHTIDGKYKGIIFDHDYKFQLNNFPIPDEVILSSAGLSELDKLSFPLTVYKGIEGTMIRLFYANEDWNMATSSRIDAYTSFWSNHKSFGKQFEEYIEEITGTPFDVFLMSLNPLIAYFFLLPTSGSNRLGKSEEDPQKQIYLVGIQVDGKLKLVHSSDGLEHNAWSFLESCSIRNVQELYEQCEHSPLVVYHPDLIGITKYVSETYATRCKLRNNCQNVVARYFELLKQNPEEATQFRVMFPEANLEFYSQQLSRIVVYIQKNYYDRYVKKEHIIVPKVYFEIMKKCHERFLQTREKTTTERVYHIILEQDAKLILSLIRNFSY